MKRLTILAVLSVEPSSTTMTSCSSGCTQATESTAPILGASLNAQMMQEIRELLRGAELLVMKHPKCKGD